MTLDEAIRHCEEVADNCAVTECEMQHRQLAGWLKELKAYKEQSGDAISRQAAIDAINSHFGFNIEEEYGSAVQEVINGLPSAQPEPAIPISWLMEEIKRLESRKNCLTVIDVAQLKAHIKRWESEQNE